MRHARTVFAVTVGLVIGYSGSTSLAQDGGYAVNIVDHSPRGPGFHPATNVLGLPDAERIDGLDTGATDFARVDDVTPGYVIVEFSPAIIQGVPGEDIVLHLYDWPAAEQETFHVDVSMNGIDFYRIATVNPLHYPGRRLDRFALGFDFGGTGLDFIRYVAIVNGKIHTAPFGHEGPDIDAVEAISLVPGPPPPPAEVTAEDSGAGGSVNVSWQANTPEDSVTGYRISFGQQSGSLDGAQLVDANVTGYQVTGLQDYVEYFFTVAAINDCGQGDPSEEVSATPTQPSGDYLKALKEVALAVKHLVHARELGIDYTACIELAVDDAQTGAQNFIAYQQSQYGSGNQAIIKAWEAYNKGVEERTAGRLSKAIKQFRLSRAHAEHAG